MKVITLPKFDEEYAKLPNKIKKKVDKQITFLMQNFRHPSLHAKKYDETNDIWQARVNARYRFYFQIRHDTWVLLNIIKHPH